MPLFEADEGREAEETFVSAMFQNLGRLLMEFHFPDEARHIRALVRPDLPRGAKQGGALDEAAAVLRELGISHEALGLGVAKVWGLPESLQRAIACLSARVPSRPIAPSLLLLPLPLPLTMKNAPFALIYADQDHPGGIPLGEKELALLRTLRNQGVMAFRQVA